MKVSTKQIEYAQELTASINGVKTQIREIIFNCLMCCNKKAVGKVFDERVEDPKLELLVKETEIRANRALELYGRIDPSWETYEEEINRKHLPEKRRKDYSAVLHDLRDPHVVLNKKNHDFDIVESLARLPRSGFRTSHYYPFVMISFFYGVIHMVAWNAFFSTLVERWMWRTVAISIMATAPSYIIWRSLFSNKGLRIRSDLTMKNMLIWIWSTLGIILFTVAAMCCAVGYGCGRLYIFAEVFANLREVPADAYVTVEWTNFIPHAG